MDYRIFWTHIRFLVSFSDSVQSKAFTGMSKIYPRSTFKSVGESIILGARPPNAFLWFFVGRAFWPIQHSD